MRRLLGLLLIAGCAKSTAVEDDVGAAPPNADAEAVSDAGVEPDAEAEDATETDEGTACALGRSCNPIVVSSFPFTDRRDTALAESDEVDRYACAPDTDESGREFWYRIDVPTSGLLRISLDDRPNDTIDVDLNLLETTDPASCLARNNLGLSYDVAAGSYYLTADTWVNGQGEELAGPYELTIELTATATGACATIERDLRMFWTSCDPSVPDCYESQGTRYLKTPTTGPVVKEAHLVTVDEDFGGGWPTSFTDQIDRHYQISELATGWTLPRSEPWAPAGEGGSEYGQAAFGQPLPVIDESWYINMYWRDRPTPGTRMIVMNPANGLAVVAAAGYETGPGSNTAIAGVAEEVHLYLGTQHRDDLMIGFAADQSLPLGPIDCESP